LRKVEHTVAVPGSQGKTCCYPWGVPGITGIISWQGWGKGDRLIGDVTMGRRATCKRAFSHKLRVMLKILSSEY